MPFISAIIPVFNGESYIAQAIESVLNQDRPADEVIVVDDGSSDRTAQQVAPFTDRIIYLHQPNGGPGTARNRGIQTARGELLTFLDADDLWLPHKLRLQEEAMASDPDLDLLFCHMDQFLCPDIPAETAQTLLWDPIPKPAPLMPCLMARRRAFERIGLLRTDVKSDFVAWYLEAQEAGLKMRTLDDLLVRRRIHGANFSLRNKDVRLEYVRLLKASLDRRRALSVTR